MKLVIISDSHGNIANLKHVMGFARKIKAGVIVHCGDWDNVAAVNAVLSFKLPLYTVLGNADVDPGIARILSKNSLMFNDQWLMFNINNRKIGVTHNLTISHQPLVIGCDVVFCGHRHFKGEKIINGVKIVHPGALHSNEPSFAVYETGTNEVKFIDL